MAIPLARIAQALECSLDPSWPDMGIENIAVPQNADAASLVFVADRRFEDSVRACPARAVLVRFGARIEGKICLEVEDPYTGYARISQLFEQNDPPFSDISRTTCSIDPSADIDTSVRIDPLCVIGRECRIGAGSIIGARCVIERDIHIGSGCRIDAGVILRTGTRIGNNVIIESGAVIGSNGFGNAWNGDTFTRIASFGNVRIEDDVWIGANVTIDRGAIEDTVIGRGARLDNLVHIAHNVCIGEHCAFAAQTGVSGSTTFGERVKVGGQAGFVGHIHIGDDTFVGAKAGVSKTVRAGSQVTGYPARDLMNMRKIEAAQASLPAMRRELKRLRTEVTELRRALEPRDGKP